MLLRHMAWRVVAIAKDKNSTNKEMELTLAAEALELALNVERGINVPLGGE